MISDFRLKVFHTVALRKNFTKAAKELCISQPAVSQNIAELEQSIGDTVFTRDRGEVNLTPKGKTLFDYSERILSLYERLDRELIPGYKGIDGNIRIAACELAVKHLLPSVISSFSSAYPEIEISLVSRDDHEIPHLIEDGIIDLGISRFVSSSASIVTEVFASICLAGASKPLWELFSHVHVDSEKKDFITKFILTAKTLR